MITFILITWLKTFPLIKQIKLEKLKIHIFISTAAKILRYLVPQSFL